MVLVGAGAGRFLVEKLANRHNQRYIDFADILNTTTEIKQAVARCATAVSVAQIMRLVS